MRLLLGDDLMLLDSLGTRVWSWEVRGIVMMGGVGAEVG